MSLYAYVDESGTQEGSQAVTMAGWVSTPKQWKKFCGQWQRKLDEFNAPHLHMRELADEERRKPTSPFYGWSRGRVDRFVKGLIPIARDNALFGLVAVSRIAGFKKMTSAIIVGHQSPYIFAFRHFFEDLQQILDGKTKMESPLAPGKKCHLIFDQQREHKETAHAAFSILKQVKDSNQLFGKLIFGESRGEEPDLPLQAADLLANRLYKVYKKEIERGEKIKSGEWDDQLRKRGNVFISYLDEEDCADFMARNRRPA